MAASRILNKLLWMKQSTKPKVIHSSFIHNKIYFSLQNSFSINFVYVRCVFIFPELNWVVFEPLVFTKIVNGIWVLWKCICNMYIEKSLTKKHFQWRCNFVCAICDNCCLFIICKDDVESEFRCAGKEMFEIDSWDPIWTNLQFGGWRIYYYIDSLLLVAGCCHCGYHRFLLFYRFLLVCVCVCLFCSSVARHRDSIWCELWMMRDKTGGYKSIHIR